MDDYKKKMIANQMEPIFKKMKVGDRGIFDTEGQEYFIAKNMPKIMVGAYKDRKYILPIEYLNDMKTGLKREAGCQITAGHFGSHFTYIPPEHQKENDKSISNSLDEKIKDAEKAKEDNKKTNSQKDDMEKYKGYELHYYPKCEQYPTHDNRYQIFKARSYDDGEYYGAYTYDKKNWKIAFKGKCVQEFVGNFEQVVDLIEKQNKLIKSKMMHH